MKKTREDLKKHLIKIKVPEIIYDLDDNGTENNRLCLNNENNKWITYIRRDNQRFDIKEFEEEAEACKYFEKRIYSLLMDIVKKKMS